MKELSYHNENRIIKGEVYLPASKSISNRLLIMRFLQGSQEIIENLSTADDTVLLNQILNHLQRDTSVVQEFNVQNAGTAMRFLTAALSTISGEFLLNCDERMKFRSIKPLVESLRKLGAEIEYMEQDGFPPLRIKGRKLISTPIKIDAAMSSQFISALLMIGPKLPQGLRIELLGNVVSKPYISMTVNMMKSFGVIVKEDFNFLKITAGKYHILPKPVEADWSSAAFFYEMVALSQEANLKIYGLKRESIQGDSLLPGIFDYLGVDSRFEEDGVRLLKTDKVQKNIRVDFSNHPDLALPFIVACAGLDVIGNFTGLENLIHKESNRVEALSLELAKFGYDFRETGFGEWVLINSCSISEINRQMPINVEIETYNDHRVAMAFAPLVLLSKTLRIKNPQVVNKSFPDFWKEFEGVIT